MEEKEYEKVLLFIGVLTTKGFPESLRASLEEKFGAIDVISQSIPFSFTDYYVPEMGEGIERFFISFRELVSPDSLREAKLFTNRLEKEWEEDGKRKINLDPGTLSAASVILATTKNRSHRIAIGSRLFAEVTLIYQNRGFMSFPWTYSDYRSEEVQKILLEFRKSYLEKLKSERNFKS